MAFDGERATIMPPPEKCVFRKCCLWSWRF